ncbi:MAG: DUF3048 domain-containing protein [Clostridia bacterium]|nr:DUF3048 domain-containing protein [Clostridia bacterium]
MKKNVLIIVVIAIVALVGGLFFYKMGFNVGEDLKEKDNVSDVAQGESEKEVVEEKNIEIFNGNERPIAFMIDNNTNAQPQASLNSTYMVYEIIVEGNESRLMALFKGKDCDSVGPIRSSRHYFLDYAMENDAIYAHLGMSPQADEQMKTFKINNINGQAYDTGAARTATSLYWRATHKNAPHNAYTNIPSIKQIAKDKGYSLTTDQESVLNYVEEEVVLDGENAQVANTITIPYSSNHKVKYEYDEETGRYTRYSKGRLMKDEVTGEKVTTKNIIVTFAENYTLNDGENKGRQDVVTVGSLDGYYITNGKAIKIKCNKESRSAQTQYVDLEGNEIKVNDGNTWVNVCPIDANVTIAE